MFTKQLRLLLTSAVLFALVFSFLPGQSTQAQGPLPPTPPVRPTVLPPHGGSGQPGYPGVSITSRQISQSAIEEVSVADVALGEPGLSYRYVKTFGTTEAPYLADSVHLNYPFGLGTYGNDVWIAELWGNRVLKYNNTGSFKQQIGIAGVTDVYDTALSELSDVAVDGVGNIWIVDNSVGHIAKFDSSGNLIGELGTLWEKGIDNNHFDNPMSVAFDSNGNVYVSDGAPWWNWDIGNHRIQVFDSAGNYLATIGETGVAGVDNDHFHGPRHITVDDNLLFVADAGNHRIQIFDISNPAAPVYEATIGVSGEEGSDATHFSNPSGVAFDGDYIYVADTWNNRVQVFDRGPYSYAATVGTGWGTGNYQFRNPSDVAIDLAGKLYVADFVNTRVQQFNRSGTTWTYTRKYGATNVPYITDGYHYNRPSGIAIANDKSMYIIEENGHRLVKLDAAGTLLWTVGKAGVKGDWNDPKVHLNNPADVALDAAGHVYVADRWYGRVKIFNADGTFYKEINNLSCPGGVFVAANGRIYVADSCDHTVRVYNKNLSLAGTIGISGESGSDNAHFNWPEDVVVDGNGNVFVTDQGNQRIQVFDSNWNYLRTMGVLGECGAQFDHFCNPNGLFVDGLNRLYVADQDNNRIQIFDSNGAYLTTIAGGWGTGTSQVRAAMGVTVDSTGNVYVADYAENHRILKFSPGIPGWKQVNLNGFGDRSTWLISALTPFDGQLYAGTGHGSGAELWRSNDGENWNDVMAGGFGDITNGAINHLIEFKDMLYAGTWNCADDGCTGGQIWRSSDGTTWTQMVGDGFGDVLNGEIYRFEVFNNQLYASTWSHDQGIHGSEVWRSDTGDSGSWEQVVANGFDDNSNNILSFKVFNGYIYATTMNDNTGAEVWRSSSGDIGAWSQVNADGFGDTNNFAASDLAIFDNNLYIVIGHQPGGGAQIWRCLLCDGSDWEQVVDNGFGNEERRGIGGLHTVHGKLYFMVGNYAAGTEVWQSNNGVKWNQVAFDGFGDSNNHSDYWATTKTVFDDSLFFATMNTAKGGQIWKWMKPDVKNINTIADTGDGTLVENEAVTELITKVLVTFNRDVKPPKVTDFVLKNAVSNIVINSVSFDALTHTATLNINGGVPLPPGDYTLTVKKTITSTDNNRMASDFVRRFNVSKTFAVPMPISPADGSLTRNYTPKLDWSTVKLPAGTSFDHYQLQVATEINFASPLLDEDIVGLTNSEFTFPSDLTPDTQYYWHVRAWNTVGQAGAWSIIRIFRTALLPPTLLSPADGESVFSLRPTFTWNISPGAVGYTIQIAKDDVFTQIIHTANPSGPSYTPPKNLPKAKPLYWRVRATGTNGPSDWSESWSFVTGNPPGIPVLLSPTNDQLLTTATTVLDWKDSTIPVGTFKHYEIQVSDSDDFTTPLIDTTTAAGDIQASDYTANLTPNTRYYWRVRAVSTIGADDHVSGWSSVWTFRAAILPPVLSAPDNGETDVILLPLLDWDNVIGNTGYTLQVWKGSTLVKTVTLPTGISEYKFLTKLLPGTTYTWKVRTKAANGPSAWSASYTFTTITYHEAPGLPDLPPVHLRLPDTPVVTTADYAVVGQYGGTIQTASWWPEVGNVQLYFAAEAPIKWNAQMDGYEPGLAESYEWSADGKTFTLHLRKGLKWSDGKPYTSADWKYWWEDFALNPKQRNWSIPAYLRNSDGTPITMEFPDAYTVVWRSKDRSLFIDPYFMAQGFWEFAKNFMKPAHYLKQFNPKYNRTMTWDDYAEIDQWWANPEFPCLFAWCLSSISPNGQNYTFSRNPYYWRVDAAGNQLPYIDKIKVELVPDEATRISNCAAGKYDTAFRICGGPNDIPFLQANAGTGGYHLLTNFMNGAGAWPGYMVNQDYVEGGQNYPDDTPEHAAEIRDLLRNHDFRVALSIGFDRQSVIDAAWGGNGASQNMTISPQSLHFADPAGEAIFDQWAASYTEFNAVNANALLDGLGMTPDIDGFRTLPSGKPFTLIIDISDWGGILQVQVDAAEEMKNQWETNLGIRVQINNLQGQQPDLDARTNEGYYMLRAAHVSELDVLTFPDWVFPVVNRYMFPLQGRWFANGGDACTEAPSEGNLYPCGLKPEDGSPAQILQTLYNEARETGTVDGRNAIVQQAIAELISSGPFVIGVSGDQPMPILVKDYMKNILDYGVVGPWAPATPGNQIAALWWMDK